LKTLLLCIIPALLLLSCSSIVKLPVNKTFSAEESLTAEIVDDFLGLARSVYIGGTLSMLTSLWPVDDEGSRLFMKVFHETSQDGDLGKAWLTARNHLKKLNYSPLIYSAFILGGTDKIL